MGRAITPGVTALAATVIGGTSYTIAQHWRSVIPEIDVDVRPSKLGGKPVSLMIIYGERGGDPFRDENLRLGQRIAHCQAVGSHCVSKAGRREFGAIAQQPQSLQVRLFDGNGNRIVGGANWTGFSHPQHVEIICDLGIRDVRSACVIAQVIS